MGRKLHVPGGRFFFGTDPEPYCETAERKGIGDNVPSVQKEMEVEQGKDGYLFQLFPDKIQGF